MKTSHVLPKVTVLGSGHSGHALAATFSHAGYPTTMVSLSRHQSGLVDIKEFCGISLKKGNNFAFCLVDCTDDLDGAVSDADIIFCTVPAFYHDDLIERILASIKDGQYIYFSSYFGALKMLKLLELRPELKNITVVESMSAIHAARVSNYGSVEILAMKDEVPIASYPETKCTAFIKLIKNALTCVTKAENVLTTSLNNVGPILHVPLMLFSAARIESTQGKGWNLYQEGLTESVQEYIKQLDKERLMIAENLGVRALPLEHTMLNIFYKYQHNGEDNFYKWIRNNGVHASKTIGAPSTINTRYLTEGVYYGLKPLTIIAKLLNFMTPIIDATIRMTDVLLQSYEAPKNINLDYLSPKLLNRIASPVQKAA